MATETDKPQIYHEKQKLQFCLLHALNNLFQRNDAFSKAGLDAIAQKLVADDPNNQSWTPLSIVFKPHHNTFTGNYDINVLIAALEEKGLTVAWHDHRNSASAINLEDPDGKLFGIVLNVPVRRYGGLWKSRHWVSVRKIGGVWYNLDSDLKTPVAFGDGEEVVEFLDYLIGQGSEILLFQLLMPTRGYQMNQRPCIDKDAISYKRNSSGRVGWNIAGAGSCGFMSLTRPEFSSPLRFLRRVGGKLATFLHLTRTPNVSSSGRPLVAPMDTFKIQAIEDCIDFINSSSSLPRSNSVSVNVN
ncbi:hypothetical protein K2173_012319 [Erythroxylum novogranatense]|uniref:ubiquitinyl hydrolase 1 n=1 Tax=Erythroxylum novogranatense TaxID=1862640 RepID=A0AAV8SCI2_9ROSI|nr:hypothetical protein K2173_012319 [Erythroxylum novogranatense]